MRYGECARHGPGASMRYQMQLLMSIQGISLVYKGQGRTVSQWRQAEHRFIESAGGWQVRCHGAWDLSSVGGVSRCPENKLPVMIIAAPIHSCKLRVSFTHHHDESAATTSSNSKMMMA